jgi:DNA-directed RNA polymerase subunit RPC12/RpoP
MTRKYKQSGYQDSDRSDRSGRSGSASTGRRPKPEGPRGRGLGKPSRSVFRCARCGSNQDQSAEVALDAVCADCGSDLRTCTNCSYFDSSAPNECRQPITLRIAGKSSRNTCEIFASKTTQEFDSDRGGSGHGSEGSSDDPKSAFDALFDF